MAQSLALAVAGTYTDSVSGITQAKSWSISATISANTPISNVASIGNTDETLAMGEMAGITPGYLFLRNLSATTSNNILLGHDGSAYPILVAPQGFGVVQWNGTAIHAKSVSTAVLEYMLMPL